MANDLNNLLYRVERVDRSLAAELRQQINTLAKRREFGLNFEKHKPETVELYGRTVRAGDKVRLVNPAASTGHETPAPGGSRPSPRPTPATRRTCWTSTAQRNRTRR